MKELLIVEKDDTIRGIIKEIVLQHFPEFGKISSAATVAKALKQLKKQSPDLVILDINLSDGTAFDLLKKVEIFDFKIVFLSEEQNQFREVIKFSSVAFVSKPFDMADMITAIDKACDAIHESDYQKKIEILLSNAASSTSSKMVVFPTLEINQATPLSSILFGEAVAGGCIMHLDSNKDFFIPIPLRHYEQLFNNHGFFRCHPFFVVNLKRIQRIDKESSLIHLDNSMKLPFEQRKYALLTERCHETGSAEY